jgi:hypothetical protein
MNSDCFVNFDINKRILPSRTWLLLIAINVVTLGTICVAVTVMLQGIGTRKLGWKTREGEDRWCSCSVIHLCLLE